MIDIWEEKLKQETGNDVRAASIGLFHLGWSGRFFQIGTCKLKYVLWDAGPLRLGYVCSIQEISRPEWLEWICEGEMKLEATVSSVKAMLCPFFCISCILNAEHSACPVEGTHSVLVEWMNNNSSKHLRGACLSNLCTNSYESSQYSHEVSLVASF